MAIPQSFLEELKSRTALSGVIGRRVRLVKKGREHSGLCPFHKEKTPSFTVNDDKGFYHCFGCGAHGSIFDFVMNTDGLTFREAVEQLAGDAGMVVPQDSPEAQAREKVRETLTTVLEKAASLFERALYMPEAKEALDYLHSRGLDDATIKKFRLGFAPNNRDAIKTVLGRDNVPEDLMVEAGLLKRPDDGRAPFGYFRNRIMFPITDRRGRVVAFGGRIMGEGEPKYLNSPETPVFQKGRMLYGLHESLGTARKEGRLIVVEGYMDVIALHKGGFPYAVAPLGTALTEDQIQMVWQIVPEPLLCFDGDNAGQRAAVRAAERALPILKSGFGIRFVSLPEGDDPDSLLLRGGAEAIERVLVGAQPLSAVLWQMETGTHTITSPEDRAALEKRLGEHVRRITDPVLRDHFQTAFRDRLRGRAGPQGTQSGGSSGGRPSRKGGFKPINARSGADSREGAGIQLDLAQKHEEILISTLINHPEIFDEVAEALGNMSFSSPDLDRLRQEALKTLAGDAGLDSDGVKSHLKDCGFNDLLGRLLGARVYDHAFFARGDVSASEAQEGWEETFRFYRLSELDMELERARERLGTDSTPEAMELLRSLQLQRQQAVGMESD